MYDPQRDRVLALVLQHGHSQCAKFGVPPTETTAFLRLHLRSAVSDLKPKLYDAFDVGATFLDQLIPESCPFLVLTRAEQAISLALENVLTDGNFALDTLDAPELTHGLVDEARADVAQAYSRAVIKALEFLNGNTAE